MKKVLLTLMCMAAMMTTCLNLNAQEVTITLNPGWTWISIPNVDTLDFATVLGTFTPAASDMIKSQTGNATYLNGQWRGSISQFYPGHGYMYKSNRTELVTLILSAQQLVSQMVVTTYEPTDITAASAVVGGTVILDEGNHIYACGVCWDTVQMPTVNNNHTTDNTGTSVFSTTLTGLTPSTTYYVRAYVVTDYGLVYGEELNFTTENLGYAPTGAINGLFSVNNIRQVYFSRGNLQYIGSASTPYWKFADNQWDYMGYAQSGASQNIDRDLFGWGTSGWHENSDPYNVNYQPWSTSYSTVNSNYNYYGYGPSTNMSASNLTGSSSNYDWGVYELISNGGNQPNQWRTLTKYEWGYVFNTRATASGIRYAKAKVNNVNGVILLPDDWNESYYTLNNTNSTGASFNSNIISASQWNIIEQYGAVFLPNAGFRDGTSLVCEGDFGRYWSTSFNGNKSAYGLMFSDLGLDPQGDDKRYRGFAVRLVKDYNP